MYTYTEYTYKKDLNFLISGSHVIHVGGNYGAPSDLKNFVKDM